MPTIEQDTMTCTREEFNALVDEALDRRIKALPNRAQLTALTEHAPVAATQEPTVAPRVLHSKEKILKTFRFFHAVAQNDRSELRSILASYEPEYVRTLAPQLEGSNAAGGYLVPPEFYADVLFLLNDYGFARKYC